MINFMGGGTKYASASGSLTHKGFVDDVAVLTGNKRTVFQGNYAFVVAYIDGRLVSIDISDPTNPSIADSVTVVGMNGVSGVALKGSYAFTVAQGDDSLIVWDISDPTNIVWKLMIDGDGAPEYLEGAYDIDIVGNYAYIAARSEFGLTIYNVSNPLAPSYAGRCFVGGFFQPQYVVVRGSYAYMVSPGEDSFRIFDVSNPAAPVLRGTLSGAGAIPWLGSASRCDVVYPYAYVAASGDDSLTIINVTNPVAPAYVTSIRGSGAPNHLDSISGVIVKDGYAFVSCYRNFAPNDAITIIDVRDPTSPSFVTWQPLDVAQHNYGCANVAIKDNLAYFNAGGGNAFTIYDISDWALESAFSLSSIGKKNSSISFGGGMSL